MCCECVVLRGELDGVCIGIHSAHVALFAQSTGQVESRRGFRWIDGDGLLQLGDGMFEIVDIQISGAEMITVIEVVRLRSRAASNSGKPCS